jgi:hypothetical protein
MSRRTALRGLGATLALPFLDSMAPQTSAAAPSTQPPRRMVFLGVEGGTWTGADGFFPYKSGPDLERAKNWGKHGILPGGFIADTGRNYKMPPTLEPLADFRKDLLIVSGLHHRNDDIPNAVVNDHGQDLGTLLTGTNISGTPGVALKNGQSFDQFVASKVGAQTRFPSLELAVGMTTYNTKEVGGLANMGYLSYDADGYALPVEGNPGVLFDRLFTDGSKGQKQQREIQRRRQKSILDSVVAELKRLQGSVSAEDRRKLDEYGATVREMERRLEQARAWDGIPVKLPPGARRPVKTRDGDPRQARTEDMRLMLDVLALALQTDVTRVVTLRLSGYYGRFDFLGFPEDPHQEYAHKCGEPGAQKALRAIDRYHVEQLAYLVGKLRGMKELGGNVLDNSMVFYGAGLNCGPSKFQAGKLEHYAHIHRNHAMVVVGSGGSRLKTGQHLNFDHGTPQANLYTAMMEVMGVHDEKFSDSTGPLPGLI